MKGKQLSFQKGGRMSVLISFLAASLLLISSCTNKKAFKLTASEQTDVDASCAVLLFDKTQNEWETPGLLESIDYLTVFTSYDEQTKSYKVGVQAFKADNSSSGGIISLTIGTGCNENLPDLAIGKNMISLEKMGILSADKKTLNKFSYIKFSPRSDPQNKYFLSYSVDVVADGVSRTINEGTLPCPPCYNCRPVPPDCEDKSDTTGTISDSLSVRIVN